MPRHLKKLNVKSSTKAEVVGMSEYLPYILWMNSFLEEPGYKLHESTVYQDNQNAMKMEKNGCNSCTGNSHHIHIRYFVVKDRLDKAEIRIV